MSKEIQNRVTYMVYCVSAFAGGYFLMDTLTKNLVLKIMKEFGLTVTEAMETVYNSQLYEKILDTDTGLYYQSSGYNYEMLREEYLNGKFRT